MMPPGQGDGPEGPYPSVSGAVMLTMMAVFAAGFTGMAFIDFGLLAAVGIGQAIGVGAVATLGAQRVAEPQAARLGLRGLEADAIPMILCLIPAILLASEMDNIAADWSGGPEGIQVEAAAPGEEPITPDYAAYENAQAERIALESDATPAELDTEAVAEGEASGESAGPEKLINVDDPASVFQAFIVLVGISPLVEEFLFRGVIQQGLLQRLGLLRGLSVVALLWTLLRPVPANGMARFLAAGIASFLLGWALGLVRIATGSILGPILLASSWAAIGLTATVYEGRIPMPGMNIDGTHLPVMVTLGSLGIVGWAGWAMFQQAQLRFAEGEPEAPMPPNNVYDLKPPPEDD